MLMCVTNMFCNQIQKISYSADKKWATCAQYTGKVIHNTYTYKTTGAQYKEMHLLH